MKKFYIKNNTYDGMQAGDILEYTDEGFPKGEYGYINKTRRPYKVIEKEIVEGNMDWFEEITDIKGRMGSDRFYYISFENGEVEMNSRDLENGIHGDNFKFGNYFHSSITAKETSAYLGRYLRLVNLAEEIQLKSTKMRIDGTVFYVAREWNKDYFEKKYELLPRAINTSEPLPIHYIATFWKEEDCAMFIKSGGEDIIHWFGGNRYLLGNNI